MLVGFQCPKDGKDRKFDYCFSSCPETCEPLPLLLSLAQSREVEDMVYSTTEILNPPQVVYMNRNFDYYESPDRLVWSTFGTAFHTLMESHDKQLAELGVHEDYHIEESFEWEMRTDAGVAWLVGTPDMYHPPTKTLWDFKTKKFYYDLKYFLPDNWKEWDKEKWQLNIYRVFKWNEAKKMKLEVLVKDWNRGLKEREDVDPIMQFDVPFIEDKVVRETAKELCEIHLTNQDDPSKIRPCTKEELWFNKDDIPLRCTEYCGAGKNNCPQFKEWEKKNEQ